MLIITPIHLGVDYHISTNVYLFMDIIILLFRLKSNKILLESDISGGIYVEKKLLKRIERLRKKLNKFGYTRDLIDSEVVEVSQQLDRLLNQYHRISAYKQLSFW